jgi:4-amino-4-deoxy-L-arabinose transferase-like glycosyltransferase
MSIMPAKRHTKDTGHKQDAISLLVLIFAASVLGVYLIAGTVLISKDGVFYTKRARELSDYSAVTGRKDAPGYPFLIFAAPFLIFAAHEFAAMLTHDSSLSGWIYSAQGITLLFRLLALIPLYFIGQLLVGGRKSFYAMLILILLPHPAKMSCEVTREWPYILFLAAGFLCLLMGARRGKWWTFGLAGLCAGLGYWIRPECAQLVVYGFMWLTLSMFRPGVGKISRPGALAALASLFVAFALPALPYMKYTGHIISPNAKRVFKMISHNTAPHQTDVRENDADGADCYAARIVPADIAKALGEIFSSIGENLMWFFMPPLLIGFYYRLQHGAKPGERFLITVFVLMNLSLMVCRYCYIEAHISNRWTLPLVAFTVFYICDGLHVIENRLSSTFKFGTLKGQKSRLGLILLLIGITICLPKLLRPAGADKRGFRIAAAWLKNNTDRQDIVAVPDIRISFYAEREGLLYSDSIPGRAKYVVRIAKGEGDELSSDRIGQKEYSVEVDTRKKSKKRVVIYHRPEKGLL